MSPFSAYTAELGNEILAKVEEYMTFNLLHINLDKCYFMYFPVPPKSKFLTEGYDKNMLKVAYLSYVDISICRLRYGNLISNEYFI